MNRAEVVRGQIDQALAMLKDFQQATVDTVYERLFVDGRSRILVADEVGLGKTIVAKGVIARRLKEKLERGDSTPLRVTYICSNQIIGQENLRKLDLDARQQSVDRSVTRLAYLAFEPRESASSLLRLNILTPATSFQTGQQTGEQRERRILYRLLLHDEELSQLPDELAYLLRGGVRRPLREWAECLADQQAWQKEASLREGLAARFIEGIKNVPVELPADATGKLALHPSTSLYDAVLSCALELTPENLDEHWRCCYHLIRNLRKVLATRCIEYIDADLYILDEFQRFRDLIDASSDAEAAVAARQIFSKPHTKVLLLSATPFKAYTGASDLEAGDEHYREFRRVLGFLLDKDGTALAEYEAHRQSLFRQLLTLRGETTKIDPSHRLAVERILRPVICRTERLSVSDQRDAMTADRWRDGPVILTPAEVQTFVTTDRLTQALNAATERSSQQLHPPVEFCKSAPWPLSFLDDYQLKKRLKARRDAPGVRDALQESRAAWLDYKQIQDYRLVLSDEGAGTVHGALALLVKEAFSSGAERLLWVPPSLPYYPLCGAFNGTDGFSKILVFSSWLMVPRMVAALLSYEAERRTIGHPMSQEPNEKGERAYFAAEGGRRHPAPQLVYRSEARTGSSNMMNFTLLYPSLTLARLFQPGRSLVRGEDRAEIEERLAEQLRQRARELKLEELAGPAGEPERWYWAAPLLLDRFSDYYRPTAERWLHSKQVRDTGFWKDDEAGETAKRAHFQDLQRGFDRPRELGLGPFPDDLFEVLAQMALGSPAVTALRALEALYDGDSPGHCVLAFSVANAFVNLFNKPEAIAAVRVAVGERLPYWRKVIRYGAEGCLQAVLDEYLHLLKADYPAAEASVARLTESLSFRTAPIKVDDLETFLGDQRKQMRCHYAVNLGNQRVETEEGGQRITSIRHTFNSPFRPFVLATTSIGQEGLDFHLYCRKVVHWNLPSNPIDLEQREGRVNRYKGHVIRLQVAGKYAQMLKERDLQGCDLWDDLFQAAEVMERDGEKCELVPYWHVETDQLRQYRIERIIPLYSYSRDHMKLTSLLKTLTVYRLTFGQPRQSELAEHLLRDVSEERLNAARAQLMIDLSPISYQANPADRTMSSTVADMPD